MIGSLHLTRMSDPIPTYIATPTGHLMVLREGAKPLDELAKLATAENLPSASFTAMGFLGEVTFGFYDFARKTYDPGSFRDVELIAMVGTIAWQDGAPSIHAHGVVGTKDFTTRGGHLLDMTVGTGSMEITVLAHDRRLERAVDPGIQANILSLR